MSQLDMKIAAYLIACRRVMEVAACITCLSLPIRGRHHLYLLLCNQVQRDHLMKDIQ